MKNYCCIIIISQRPLYVPLHVGKELPIYIPGYKVNPEVKNFRLCGNCYSTVKCMWPGIDQAGLTCLEAYEPCLCHVFVGDCVKMASASCNIVYNTIIMLTEAYVPAQMKAKQLLSLDECIGTCGIEMLNVRTGQ